MSTLEYFKVGSDSRAQWRRVGRAGVLGLLLVSIAVSGCTQFEKLKARHYKVKFTPASAPTRAAPAVVREDSSPARSLAWIVNHQLQRGRYAEGEASLRHYLAQHPDDRAAQSMLRQVTVDPQRWLGPASRPHVVQPGESYSTLAKRELGDSGLFVILARYNESSRPSMLLVGQTIRLPVAPHATPPEPPQEAPAVAAAAGHGSESAAAAPASPAAGSLQLQRESLALLNAGQSAQALKRLDEALAIDPGLAGPGDAAASLRQALVASCHQRAIVLYRDQKLDPAIALWDRVLAIHPGYEPAIAYRARALELKRRLKQY